MRKSYNDFGTIYNMFENANSQMRKNATEFVTKIISNNDTKRCGELIEERLRIKFESSFNGNIDIVVVDKVVYNNDKGLLVYEEDGGVIVWEDLYTDDMALLANTIYTRFQEDFMSGDFDVCVDGISILDEYADYLTAFEIQNDYKAKNVGYVGIDEIF